MMAMEALTGPEIMRQRRARGWSRTDLGDHLGVTRQTVRFWETEATVPNDKHRYAIAALFSDAESDIDEVRAERDDARTERDGAMAREAEARRTIDVLQRALDASLAGEKARVDELERRLRGEG